MKKKVETSHLVMKRPGDLRPRLLEDPGVTVVAVDPPNPQFNHAMFMEIGTPFNWYSRLSWTFEQWETYANDPLVQTWVGAASGVPFGYFELMTGPESGVTEIMFFGVFKAFSGRGYGGHLLTRAVEAAWAHPKTRTVYVHTCTSDHPAALANYTARGFTLERTHSESEDIPDRAAGIWCSPAYYRTLPG